MEEEKERAHEVQYMNGTWEGERKNMLGQTETGERRLIQMEKRVGTLMDVNESNERKIGRLTEVGQAKGC